MDMTSILPFQIELALALKRVIQSQIPTYRQFFMQQMKL